MIHEGLSRVTPEHWKPYEDHVIRIEDDMWQKENLVDLFHATHISPVIITPYAWYVHRNDDHDEED